MQYTRRNITRFLTGLGMMMFIIPHLTAATVLPTATPIKHVIIIVGENHSFDSLFATYVPVHGQKVHNLLSQGIIKYDGTPGSHYAKAMQMQATVHQKFSISPADKTPYIFLPRPNTGMAFGQRWPANSEDQRFPAQMPNGPFQITKYVPYAYGSSGNPVHRFFQMWQQYDRGLNDLYVWTGNTVGIGSGNSSPAPVPGNSLQGAEPMGYYNMLQGDAPTFRYLADHFASSDNYHQAVMGGTGANFLAIATGGYAAIYNKHGKLTAPPANQIEDPNPRGGTNNFYKKDGYHGGSYVKCADTSEPGVKPIHDYLKSLDYKVFNEGNCSKGAYYLVNNYTLGYTPSGKPRKLGKDEFTLPPQYGKTIADLLSENGISWKWYTGGRNGGSFNPTEYCGVCDPLVAFKSIMTTDQKKNLQGMNAFFNAVKTGTLPSVSFITPYESESGHPSDSTMTSYEKFLTNIVNQVIDNDDVWKSTAILITTDEGGGYYDSGYIQPIDFFGDGPRIPMLLVSPYAKHGHVDHNYADHASLIKFIEHNWHLKTISKFSRDNLPNPVASKSKPYQPINRPAIGDMLPLFDFSHYRKDISAIPEF